MSDVGSLRMKSNEQRNLTHDKRDDLAAYEFSLFSSSSATAASSYPTIEIRLCTTLQAAQSLVDELGEDRVGILNFASAKNAGGGFIKGSCAQEESLARSSSLYSTFIQKRIFNEFYDYNRRGKNALYSHRLIYSPRVTIIKDDNCDLLSSPYHVDIVTIPAPNASVIHQKALVQTAMMERIRRLLLAFEIHQHDSLVLGAFGCRVFKNDRVEVATILRQYLESDRFKNSFKRIVFAINNYDTCQLFKQVFTDTQQNFTQTFLENASTTKNQQRHDHRHKNNRRHQNRFSQVVDRNLTNCEDDEDGND